MCTRAAVRAVAIAIAQDESASQQQQQYTAHKVLEKSNFRRSHNEKKNKKK